MKNETVNKILEETEIGYDQMSQKFSETRKFFWRGLEFIKDYAQKGDRLLDFGCGNGRLLELLADLEADYTGVDISQNLLDIASRKYAEKNAKFQKISGYGSLSFPDNYFNSACSIAVFHHIPSYALRLKIAEELHRVTRPGGHVVVTVWNLWQKNYIKNICINWLQKIAGKSKLDWNDCYIDFKNNQGETFHRYHHAFTKSELRKLFSQAGFLVEKCEIIVGRNIVLTGIKNNTI